MTYNYESPLNDRYASNEMKYIFSKEVKYTTWRKLWLALAKAQKELGLNITDEQIKELELNVTNLNLDVALEREKEVKHDVMSHVYAYGVLCPKAKPIIHLGATSCYVGDNTDLIVMRDALILVRKKIVSIINILSEFALLHKDLPTLGFTHFQAAQLTTVGKRSCMWIQDLTFDLDEINFILDNIKLLGSKGTTGTQASFFELFNNDETKVIELDRLIAKEMGFDSTYPISGQTYSRKVDSRILNVLSSIAQSTSKFSNDLRLLQSLKEIEEPFAKSQIGSSAMAYKRNPMRSERITSLSRFVMSLAINPAMTASTQWFERTLDDSANKRLSVTEAFLTVDAVLNLYMNVTDGLVVYPKMIEKHINEELPFMATENIIMMGVKNGLDRQELHEKIRVYSMEAGFNVKNNGLKNDLIERLLKDTELNLNKDEVYNQLNPKNYIGLADKQTEKYINEIIKPLLNLYKNEIIKTSELTI